MCVRVCVCARMLKGQLKIYVEGTYSPGGNYIQIVILSARKTVCEFDTIDGAATSREDEEEEDLLDDLPPPGTFLTSTHHNLQSKVRQVNGCIYHDT